MTKPMVISGIGLGVFFILANIACIISVALNRGHSTFLSEALSWLDLPLVISWISGGTTLWVLALKRAKETKERWIISLVYSFPYAVWLAFPSASIAYEYFKVMM